VELLERKRQRPLDENSNVESKNGELGAGLGRNRHCLGPADQQCTWPRGFLTFNAGVCW